MPRLNQLQTHILFIISVSLKCLMKLMRLSAKLLEKGGLCFSRIEESNCSVREEPLLVQSLSQYSASIS